MVTALKITLIFYGIFIFYLFGRYEKIPYSARQTIFVIGNGGCLFLAGGLVTSNFYSSNSRINRCPFFNIKI